VRSAAAAMLREWVDSSGDNSASEGEGWRGITREGVDER
jgi:hypothetical protein